jgi:hypothetical protein
LKIYVPFEHYPLAKVTLHFLCDKEKNGYILSMVVEVMANAKVPS